MISAACEPERRDGLVREDVALPPADRARPGGCGSVIGHARLPSRRASAARSRLTIFIRRVAVSAPSAPSASKARMITLGDRAIEHLGGRGELGYREGASGRGNLDKLCPVDLVGPLPVTPAVERLPGHPEHNRQAAQRAAERSLDLEQQCIRCMLVDHA